MILPSKELFCKVLSLPSEDDTKVVLDGDKIILKKDKCDIFNINIFEFAFKLKKWVYNILELDYIDSGVYTNDDYEKYYRCMIYKFDEDTYVDEICLSFEANTEVEAIIKAGEYVLKEIK